MNWHTIALAAAPAVIAFQFWRAQRLHGCATRVAERLVDHQLALRYIAAGSTFPHDADFARAFLAGNDFAMRQRFHGFATFRAIELERMEEDDNA